METQNATSWIQWSEDLQKRFSQIHKLYIEDVELKKENSDDLEKALHAPSIPIRIVVSKYKAGNHSKLLQEVFQKSLKEKIHLVPVVWTEEEASLFFSSKTSSWDWAELFKSSQQTESSKTQLNHRDNAVQVLKDLEGLMRAVQSDFIMSTSQLVTTGEILRSILHQILAISFALEGRTFQNNEADFRFLNEALCGPEKLFEASFAGYAMQLDAFILRYQTLLPQRPKVHGEHDREVERLLKPLRKASRSVKRSLQEKKKIAFSIPWRSKRIWYTAVGLLLVTMVGLGIYAWTQRLRLVPALKNFKHKKHAGALTGTYYKGSKFQKAILEREDAKIDTNWHTKSPHPLVPKDRFSIRWKGFLRAQKTGVYKVCFYVDDGVRFFLHKKKVLDAWKKGPARLRCTKQLLAAGWHPIRIEYMELTWKARLEMSWQPPNAKKRTTIPPTRLCCRSGKAKPSSLPATRPAKR